MNKQETLANLHSHPRMHIAPGPVSIAKPPHSCIYRIFLRVIQCFATYNCNIFLLYLLQDYVSINGSEHTQDVCIGSSPSKIMYFIWKITSNNQSMIYLR